MSGMYETSLLIACGRQNELGQVTSKPAAGTLDGQARESGTDVLVNNPAGDAGGSSHTQSETSIVRNETTGTLCSAYNDSYHGVVQARAFRLSRSTDGGATWVDKGAFPSGAGSVNSGDPSMTWRKSDGNFYYAALHASGLGLWKLTDGCNTFTWVGKIHIGTQDDKELMAMTTPWAAHFTAMVVAWINFNDARIYSTYSTNGGTTWSTPVALSGAGVSVQGAWPYFGPNGEIYVAWVRWNPYPSGPIDIEIVRSTNGGVSYAPVTNPLTGGINPGRPDPPLRATGRPSTATSATFLRRRSL